MDGLVGAKVFGGALDGLHVVQEMASLAQRSLVALWTGFTLSRKYVLHRKVLYAPRWPRWRDVFAGGFDALNFV
ncbi:hypothetical protein EBH_0082690 [Eimeria brunetti]|uniref:Uncharacterized protein n=1 Tax=Eimeria brunetti TaxID=51314 RepID=U6LFQ9_9EIME|nr:hypothetical protein EBH_0082690 [Eimeria brunetti]